MSQRFIGGFNKPGYDPLANNVTVSPTVVQNGGIFTSQAQAEADGTNSWVSDPNFSDTILLLQADGFANGSTNNTFLDSSGSGISITRNGDTTQGAVTPYFDKGWSGFFNGSSYLSTPDSSAFDLTGDFTFEAWVYPTVFGAQNQIITQWSGSPLAFQFKIVSSRLVMNLSIGGTITTTGTSTTVVLNQWQHVAATRSGSTVRLFVNGVQDATTGTASGTASGTATIVVGATGAIGSLVEYFTGYISNLRLLNGTALYTSSFKPPTAPLSPIATTTFLTLQNSWFKDNSSLGATITPSSTAVIPYSPFPVTTGYTSTADAGSGYFDGTGDYLNAAANAAFAFGTNDFTIEFWVYPTSTARQDWVDTNSGSIRVLIYATGSVITVFTNPPNAAIITGPTMQLNAWQHIAVSKSGGSTRLFVNGVQKGTTYAVNQNYGTSQPLTIGKDASGTTVMTGYMADLRIVKGTGLYTVDFPPPTQPLQPVSGTSFLLNFSNAGVYSPAATSNALTAGSTQVSTSVVKYGSGAIYFDGTGDYLQFPNSPLYAFYLGNYTFEAWIYPTAARAQVIFDTRTSATSTTGLAIQLDASNKIVVTVNNAALITTANAVQLSMWSHVAVVKIGSQIYAYVNGQLGASSSGGSVVSQTEQALTIGTAFANRDTTTTNHFQGYMDEVRITKGVARYSGQYFTPPPRSFPKQ